MFSDQEELAQILSPLNNTAHYSPEGVFIVYFPVQLVTLRRHWYYWSVTAHPGLPKEDAIELCRTNGQDVRALGYGRKGLTPEELETILEEEYHQVFAGYCREWHCDTLSGLGILLRRLAE